MLAGMNAFVTYKGDFEKNANLTLYRVIDGEIEGELVDFPVVKVVINDGYQETVTHYDYSKSEPTVDPSGIVTQYPRVEVIRGSNEPSDMPFGKTEHYFINGLSPDSFIRAFGEEHSTKLDEIINKVRVFFAFCSSLTAWHESCPN